MNSILSRAIDHLFELAKSKRIKATQISKDTGISNTQLSLIRHKKTQPTFETLDKIARVVETSLPLVFIKVLLPEDLPEEKREQLAGIQPILKPLINSL